MRRSPSNKTGSSLCFCCSTLCIILSLLLPYCCFASSTPRRPGRSRLWPVPVIGEEVFHSPEIFKLDYDKMERNFKVFLYPDIDDNKDSHRSRSRFGKYASEGYFFENIRESHFVTENPDEAHLFFIPISCHQLRGQGKTYEDIADSVSNYVHSLISIFPYWNRTLGADHFFMSCHDSGLAATKKVSHLAKNSIRVVCSPTYDSDYIPHKDVSVPQIVQPFRYDPAGYGSTNRTVLGFWAGLRNSEIRDILVDVWGNDTELAIRKNNKLRRHWRFHDIFYDSKFCICPAGSGIHGGRIADAIRYGCVPVILSDHYDLPFNDILDWRKFSLILKEKDVYDLKNILKSIPEADYRALQRNTIKVQKHFQWNSPPARLDAFHMVMYELWLRRHTIRYQ